MGSNAVKKSREERLMSRAELARKAGISPQTLERVERGKLVDWKPKGRFCLPSDMPFQTKKRFIKKNKSMVPFRVSLRGITGMRERCFRSMLLPRKDCSVEYAYQNRYAHQNGCTARLVNRGSILMNAALSLIGLMSVYFLYQVLLLY